MSFYNKSIVATLLISSSQLTLAAETNQQAEVKCYLELVGGDHSINYYYLPLLKGNNKIDIDKIYNIKVMANGSKQKRSVYKVKECVLADKTFKTAKAKMLEQTSPR